MHRQRHRRREGIVSNNKPECPKCGSDKISKEYHIKKEHESYSKCCGDSAVNSSDKEHIHFYCETCNYDWVVECSPEVK